MLGQIIPKYIVANYTENNKSQCNYTIKIINGIHSFLAVLQIAISLACACVYYKMT